MATLRADLISRTTGFERGMKRAETSLQRFERQATRAFKMATVGAGVLTGALTALTIRQMGVIDQTAKTSARLGVLSRDFQALSLVAGEAGVESNTLETSLQRMRLTISQATQGIGTGARALDALGLSAKDLNNLSPDKQIEKIAKAMGGLANENDKARVAYDLFGRQGAQVIHMMRDLATKTDEAREFNDRFNISLSETDTSKVEEANDAFGRVKLALTGIGNTLAVEFAPIVTAVSNALLQAGVDGESFTKALQMGLRAVFPVIDLLKRAIHGMQIMMAGVTIVVQELALELSNSIQNLIINMSTWPTVGDQFIGSAVKMTEATTGLNDALGDSYTRLMRLRNTQFESTADQYARIQKDAEERLRGREERETPNLEHLIGQLSDATEGSKNLAKAQKSVNDQIRLSTPPINEFGNSVGRAFEGFVLGANSARSALRGLINDLQQMFLRQAVTNPLMEMVSGFTQSAFSSAFATPASDITWNGPRLQGFAGGGIATRASIFGESGAEAAVPLPDGRRIPVDLRTSGGGDTYYIDARGADRTGLANLEAMIAQVNGSIEHRAVSAMKNAQLRGMA